jgi:hypothetical protein
MITSFVLNQPHNALFRKKKSSVDDDIHLDILFNNIKSYTKSNPKNPTFFLPIQNWLWVLWKEAFIQGNKEARLEQAVFHNNNELATFASRDDKKRLKEIERQLKELEKKKQSTEKELDRINTNWKKNDGEWDRSYIAKEVFGIKGSPSEQERIRANVRATDYQKALNFQRETTSKEMSDLLPQYVDLKQAVATPKSRKVQSNEVNTGEVIEPKKRTINSRTRKVIGTESRRGQSRKKKEEVPIEQEVATKRSKRVPLDDFEYNKNTPKGRAAAELQSRRKEIESTLPENIDKSKFADIYLNQRLSEVANLLNKNLTVDENAAYSKLLNDKNKNLQNNRKSLVDFPEYLKSNNADKDQRILNKINTLMNTERREKLKTQIATLENIAKRGSVKFNPDEREYLENLKRTEADLQKASRPNFDKISEIARKIAVQKKRIQDQEQKIELTREEKQAVRELQGTLRFAGTKRSDLDITQQDAIIAYKNAVGELDRIDNNLSKIKQVANTELTTAHNLGRINHFIDTNQKFVRWDVSREHERRDVVCVVCNERANNNERGFGRGIYELSEVLRNPQLHIPLHPSCLCILTPVSEDDVDKKKKGGVPIFQNNVSKWAAGGVSAILGTALLIALFLRAKGHIPPSAEAPRNPFTPRPPRPSPLPPYLAEIPNVNQVIREFAPQIVAEVLKHQIELIPLQPPMEKLVPLQPPMERVLVEMQEKELNRTLQAKSPIGKKLRSVIQNTEKTAAIASSLNPQTPQGIPILTRTNTIRSRLQYYDVFDQQTNLTVRTNIFNEYLNDIDYIQSTINKIRDTNVTLYYNLLAIDATRNEIEDQLFFQGFDAETIANNPLVQRLDSSRITAYDSLQRSFQQMNEGGFFGELNDINSRLLENPELADEYAQRSSAKMKRMMKDIKFIGLGKYKNEVDTIRTEIENTRGRFSDNRYRQLVLDLDTLNNVMEKQSKKISLMNIDFRHLIESNIEQLDQSRAAFLIDYKFNGIQSIQRDIEYTLSMLINKQKQ